jgi:hypothetical protein
MQMPPIPATVSVEVMFAQTVIHSAIQQNRPAHIAETFASAFRADSNTSLDDSVYVHETCTATGEPSPATDVTRLLRRSHYRG